MIYILIFAVIWGFICEYLGNQKGQKGCFLYGFLLGIIGLIIVCCLKDKNPGKNIYINKYDDIEKITKLKEAGVITQEEFEPEKEKLLK